MDVEALLLAALHCTFGRRSLIAPSPRLALGSINISVRLPGVRSDLTFLVWTRERLPGWPRGIREDNNDYLREIPKVWY